jgi:hypothetical protein
MADKTISIPRIQNLINDMVAEGVDGSIVQKALNSYSSAAASGTPQQQQATAAHLRRALNTFDDALDQMEAQL